MVGSSGRKFESSAVRSHRLLPYQASANKRQPTGPSSRRRFEGRCSMLSEVTWWRRRKRVSVCSTVREAKPSWHSTLYDSCFCVHGNSGCTPRRCRHLSSPSRQSSDLSSSWPQVHWHGRSPNDDEAATEGQCEPPQAVWAAECTVGWRGRRDGRGACGTFMAGSEGSCRERRFMPGANPSLSSPRPYIAPPLPRFLSLLPPPCLQIHPSSRPQTSLPRSP